MPVERAQYRVLRGRRVSISTCRTPTIGEMAMSIGSERGVVLSERISGIVDAGCDGFRLSAVRTGARSIVRGDHAEADDAGRASAAMLQWFTAPPAVAMIRRVRWTSRSGGGAAARARVRASVAPNSEWVRLSKCRNIAACEK